MCMGNKPEELSQTDWTMTDVSEKVSKLNINSLLGSSMRDCSINNRVVSYPLIVSMAEIWEVANLLAVFNRGFSVIR